MDLREDLQRPEISQSASTPSSLQQEGLWLHLQVYDDARLFNIPVVLQLRGNLDSDALRRACHDLVQRHEPLRTIFEVVGGKLRQLVLQKVDIAFRDLGSLRPEQLDDEVFEFVSAPFDLAAGPLIRFALIRIAPEHHVLAISVHHIAFDPQSRAILLSDLDQLYRAETTGRSPALSPLAYSYAEFSSRQRSPEADARRARLLQAARADIAGAAQSLSLPGVRTRSSDRSGYGRQTSRFLSPASSDLLAGIARQERATEFIVAIAAFRVLLHQLTGETDALIATPMSGRGAAGLEPLIGMFLDLGVVRRRLSPSESFRDIVRAERAAVFRALDRRDLPFAQMATLHSGPRHIDSPPLAQVSFSYRLEHEADLRLGDLIAEDFHMAGGAARFDLSLDVIRSEKAVEVICGYDEGVLPKAMAERHTERFVTLLTRLLESPSQPIRLLDLSSIDDRKLVETASCRLFSAAPASSRTYLDEVLRQAEAHPETIAIEAVDGCMSYREMIQAAWVIAKAIKMRAPGEGAHIGLATPRTTRLVTSLLGVGLAGCVAVPIDLLSPAERNAAILEDAAVVMVIAPQAAVLPDGFDGVRIDPDAIAPFAGHQTPPRSDVSASQCGYLMYTSGSTGRPKGVAVSHGSIAGCLLAMRRLLSFQVGEKLLAVSNIAFDLGVMEVLLPLLSGGVTILADPEQQRDGEALAAAILRYEPDYMHGTPALWEVLFAAGWVGAGHLVAMVGGDVVSPALASRIVRSTKGLWHAYGPTEATMYCVFDLVSTNDGPVLPIGRPISSVSAFVLNAQMNPTPPGALGELYIGGACVADGYAGLPRLTAERFLPDPFAIRPGQRLYRTGDLANLGLDGRFQVHGRLDGQLKIRGFRIETGEIEAALLAHPDVEEAVVLGFLDGGGEKRLAAYIRPNASSPLMADDLRAHLKSKLPAYMWPSAFVLLKDIPQTPNGKIDRKALPPPIEDDPARHLRQPPATPTERHLAEIWMAELGVSAIGIHQTFFDLGGHSVTGMRVIASVNSDFNVRTTLKTIFDLPTLHDMARYIDDEVARNEDGLWSTGAGADDLERGTI